jgi:uncharacterized protein (DUF2164 family)
MFGYSRRLYWLKHRVTIKFHETRDLVYIRLRRYLRQEYSSEIEDLADDVIIDVRTHSVLTGCSAF